MKKKILILGASGSMGSQTVDVIQQHNDLYEICGVSIGKNIAFLRNLLSQHKIPYVCVKNQSDADLLASEFPESKFYYGDEGLITLTSLDDVDIVYNCIQGFPGLLPTINAIEHHHDVAIANKESLVAAGDIVNRKVAEYGVRLIPLDSEHSAIFQTLNGYRYEDIHKIIITASGGAFKNLSRDQLENVSVADAVKHPHWNMGTKITIDSASMMNKGFEIIEAHVLFHLPYSQIDTVIHPESIIHSMTEFNDKVIIAQMGMPDMRMPIQYALTYPERIYNNSEYLDLVKLGSLTFKKMDTERFPLVSLAYYAGEKGGNLPAILNGANEKAVDAFINGKCKFLDIEKFNFEVCKLGEKEIFVENPTLEDIIFANNWAERKVEELLKG